MKTVYAHKVVHQGSVAWTAVKSAKSCQESESATRQHVWWNVIWDLKTHCVQQVRDYDNDGVNAATDYGRHNDINNNE